MVLDWVLCTSDEAVQLEGISEVCHVLSNNAPVPGSRREQVFYCISYTIEIILPNMRS